MRLEAITLQQLRRAVDLYMQEAYRGVERPDSAQLRAIGAAGDGPVGEHLELFQDETAQNPHGARSYVLRLGNQRYRFMKLRLQEQYFRDEFFFSVDTHDQMFADDRDPELAQLKAYNRDLKDMVEAAWEGAGLPTTVNLKGLCDCMPVESEPRKGLCVLLVDDNVAIQDTIATMLRVKGYDVDLAGDGEEALEKADPRRHALVLMDVEMPRMNGVEACRELKADPQRRRIPVLLASAGAIELARQASPDGFLVKPFHAEALFRFLDALLRESPLEATSPSR